MLFRDRFNRPVTLIIFSTSHLLLYSIKYHLLVPQVHFGPSLSTHRIKIVPKNLLKQVKYLQSPRASRIARKYWRKHFDSCLKNEHRFICHLAIDNGVFTPSRICVLNTNLLCWWFFSFLCKVCVYCLLSLYVLFYLWYCLAVTTGLRVTRAELYVWFYCPGVL